MTMTDDDTAVDIRLRRSTADHDAYTVRVADRRVAVLATTRNADVRQWVATTRWLHARRVRRGRLVVGLGVQWTPRQAPLRGYPPPAATLQLCVGHRCLVFHLARAGGDVPQALRRFLEDPRVTFVGGCGSALDLRVLAFNHGIRVACARDLRGAAGMGNHASLGQMADRFLGYPGISKPRAVAMSAWHAPLSPDQVQYACVDAYLAFRLGIHLLPTATDWAAYSIATPREACHSDGDEEHTSDHCSSESSWNTGGGFDEEDIGHFFLDEQGHHRKHADVEDDDDSSDEYTDDEEDDEHVGIGGGAVVAVGVLQEGDGDDGHGSSSEYADDDGSSEYTDHEDDDDDDDSSSEYTDEEEDDDDVGTGGGVAVDPNQEEEAAASVVAAAAKAGVQEEEGYEYLVREAVLDEDWCHDDECYGTDDHLDHDEDEEEFVLV